MRTREDLSTWVSEYHAAGWTGVVPLPSRKKYSPPAGTTGEDGVDLTEDEAIAGLHEDGNIGLRLPDGVIGIDVDAYSGKTGDRTMLFLEYGHPDPERHDDGLGELPHSPVLSSRNDGVSGIRFYRVPTGLKWRDVGADVETISRSWRYAVTAPSVHPNTKAEYVWRDFKGDPCPIPRVQDLPDLPSSWVKYLSSRGGRARGSSTRTYASWPQVQDVLNSFRAGSPCRCVRESGEKGMLAAAKNDGTPGRVGLLGPVLLLLRQGIAGCAGVDETITRIHAKYVARDPDHDAKFWQLIATSVHKAQEESWICTCKGCTTSEPFHHAATLLTAEQDALDPGTPAEPYRSRLRSGSAVIRNTTIPWLVKDLLHQFGLGQFSAPENTGKSIITVDLALSIANGFTHWAGHEIQLTGPVIYCAMEGGPVIESYIDAWLHNHPGTDLENFYILDEEELDLSDQDSIAHLMMDISASDISPVLIVFDTQIDVTGTVDEMSPEIGQLLAEVRRWLATELKCFGLFLHHPPYEARRGRGSTSVRGKNDVLAFFDKKGSYIEWQKVKGRLNPPNTRFKIVPSIGHQGPVVEYPETPGLGELATSPGATAATSAVEKDEQTKAAILEILQGQSPSMIREKNPTRGWGNGEVTRALEGYLSRPEENGGPRNVHVNKTYVSPCLDELHNARIITDHTEAWRSGMPRQWALT